MISILCIFGLRFFHASGLDWFVTTHNHEQCKHMGNDIRCSEAPYLIKVKEMLNKTIQENERLILKELLAMYDRLEESKVPDVFFVDKKKAILLHPIGYAIPSEYIVPYVQPKYFGMTPILQEHTTTASGKDEFAYFKHIDRSMFVVMQRKVGWDSLRNVEIIARGTLIIYLDTINIPKKVMGLHPLNLYRALSHYPGLYITEDSVDNNVKPKDLNFDMSKSTPELYLTVANGLLQYTRNVLSAEASALHILDATLKYSGGRLKKIPKSILYLSNLYGELSAQDIMDSTILIGLKNVLGHANVIDYPRNNLIFRLPNNVVNQTLLRQHKMHSHGRDFEFVRILDHDYLHETNNREPKYVRFNVRKHKYDMIVLTHREMHSVELFDLICTYYKPWEVVVVNGEDQPTSGANFKFYSKCVGHIFTKEGVDERSLLVNEVDSTKPKDLNTILLKPFERNGDNHWEDINISSAWLR